MNTPIRTAYFSALLAQASYVEGLRAQDTGQRLEDQLVEELTRPLGKLLSGQFRVVMQFTDPASGFSVTAFADSNGTQYISFRGPEFDSPLDWITNFDAYFASGLGRRQVIAMVNWYLRASTPASMQAVQMLETPVVDQLTGEVLATTVIVQGEGTLPAAGSYVVNGHSLGGHLTTVFSRLFNSRVASSHTFNGLGVGQVFPESLIGEIETTLGLGVTSWTAVDAKQKNFYAQHGISVATTDWWLQQRGERIALFNEVGVLPQNHSMYKLTDVLALYDVLGTLDGGLSIADATAILNAASASAPASLESVLDALRRLYQVTDQTPVQIGDAGGNIASRADFYTKLAGLRTTIGSSPSTTVASLVGMNTAELVTRAQAANGLAYRYALKEVNPFAVLGPDTLYEAHNAAGELNLFVDAVSTPAGMTTEYLADRIEFLAAKNAANVADAPSVIMDAQPDNWRYVDLESMYRVTAFGTAPGTQTRMAAFGGGGSDVLQGGLLADRLYGGRGVDILNGGRGDDYLEGGAGLDVYQYNASSSLTGQLSAEGVDEIRDTDGKGALRYAFTQKGLFSDTVTGAVVGGVGIKISESQWQSPDGKFTYAQQFDGALAVTINGDAGGTIRILDFDFTKAAQDGFFGIRLVEGRSAPQTPQTSPDIEGDREVLVTTANVSAILVNLQNPDGSPGGQEWQPQVEPNWTQLEVLNTYFDASNNPTAYDIRYKQFDDLDNLVRSLNPQAGFEDSFKDSSGPDHIVTGGGADTVTASRGGDDVIETGDGDDNVWGGAGNDWIDGGAANDTLLGEAGDDFLTGGAHRDIVEGGEGSDWLEGEADADIVAGGDGDDAIFGGTGRDTSGQAFGLAFLVAAGQTASATPGQGDLLDGGAGKDPIVGATTADLIAAGTEADLVLGGAGDDTIYGDGAIPSASLDWFVQRNLSTVNGARVYDVIRSFDIAFADDLAVGGADVIYGGAGEDWTFGSAGDDTIDAGSGNDIIEAGAGDDYAKPCPLVTVNLGVCRQLLGAI